jgi:hypothetical protein
MARSGTYGTKQNKEEDCRQWHMHHQGATGISKKAQCIVRVITCNDENRLLFQHRLMIDHQ